MTDSLAIELSTDELRRVARFAADCAQPAVFLFESERPGDLRARAAIEAGQAFADGAPRTKLIRDCAWAAFRAAADARDAGQMVANEAARAAVAASSAAYLHPLAKATQVKHILGSAAHAARAFEIAADDDPSIGLAHICRFQSLAHPVVVSVLRRYPTAPTGGGRAGELLRMLDDRLRQAG